MFVQIARRGALRRHLILTTALCGAALLPDAAAAQQMGDFGSVIGTVGGGTTVSMDGADLNVSAQGNGIVNWNDFNIREGRTASFRNRDGAGAPTISILNRVNGATGTDISGTLNSDSNVNVYLINRSGIVFGAGARVNVGGLVASTLDLDDSDLLNGDQSLHFIGNMGETRGIDVKAGAAFNVPGDLVMLGAYVNAQASMTAGGDLAFVAGNDIVVQSAAGAPLKFVINRGTAVPGAIRVQGDLKGQNVTLAMATRAGINNALLYIDGSVESTGARAIDNGVVLASGMSPYLSNVEVAAGAETAGLVATTHEGGTLKSAASVTVYGNGRITLGDLSAGFQDPTRRSDVFIHSPINDVNVGNVYASANIGMSGTSVRVNDLHSQAGFTAINAGQTGLVAVNGNVKTGTTFTIDGGSVYLGWDDDAETFDLGWYGNIKATGGAIYGGKGLTLNTLTGPVERDLKLTAATDILFDRTSAINLRGPDGRSGALLLSTGAAASTIALGDVTARGIAGLQGRLGDIRFGNLNLIDSLEAGTSSGSVFGGSVRTNGHVLLTAAGSISVGAIHANSFTQLAAQDAVKVDGDVRASVISLYGRRVEAGNLTADGIAQVESVLDQVIVGNIAAQNVDIKSASHLTVGDITAQGDATLTAGGFAIINGNATIGRNYSVTGSEVHLGDDAGDDLQKADGTVTLTSTGGRVVGGSGLHLRGVGGVKMISKGDVAFASDSRIYAAGSGLSVSTGAATDRIALGDLGATNISGLTGRQNSITIGNVATGFGFDIGTTAGDITVGNIEISGTNQSLSLTNSGGKITAGNLANASNNLAITASSDIITGDIGAKDILLDGKSISTGKLLARNLIDARSRSGNASFALLDGHDILLSTAGTGNLTVAGIKAGNDASINAAGDVQINGNVSVNRHVNWSGRSLAIGAVQPGTMNVGGVANMRATDGDITISSATRVTGAGATLTAEHGSVVLNGELSANAATLRARDRIDLNANLIADTLTLTSSPFATTTKPSVTQAGGVLTVGRIETVGTFGAISLNGANQIDRIGNLFATSIDMTNAGDLALEGMIGALQTRIRNNGGLTIAQGGQFGANQTVALSANTLTNLAGAAAMGSGVDWKIFLQSPQGNDFGGLDSGQTAVWGKTLDSDISGINGNRYVFAWRPTLTFTSLDAGKTYGDDATALLAGRYTVSGLQQGVAGAFLGDTLASAFAGSPLLSSLGIAANADVAGGPYAIEIGRGSLTSDAGYDFAFDSAGRLSIARKAVIANVAVDNKTYDGTKSGTGRIVIDGALAGDDVGASATYTFTDKNAGAGKNVGITGFTLSGGDAGNYTVTVPASVVADILRKAVNVSATIDNKTYDGTTAASGRIAADGLIAGDDVQLAGGSYAFADKNAGAGKAVRVSGISVTGSDAANYRFTIPTSAIADILRKAVTVQIAADTKVYDGTTGATGRITGIDGVLAGDDLTASGGNYAFADKNAGAGKSVGVSGIALGGADAGNYEVTVPRSAIADILRRAVHVAVSVDDKTYDGTRAAAGRVTGADGLVAGDDVAVSGGSYSFADKNAGAGKAVGVSGIGLSGGDAGNYSLVVPTSVLADILRKAVNVTATIDNKTYDGTTAATGRVSAQGVIEGDDVRFSGGNYAFADKNAGVGKSVAVSGINASGADAGNYDFTLPANTVADILRKAVMLAVAVDNKTYDGTARANGRITGLSGVIAGDDLTANGGSYAFSDKNAGQGKQVGVSGIAIGGADAGNYDVTMPTSVLANILRKSLGVAIAADDKIYDGTTAASGRVTGLSGAVEGDAVSVGGGSYAFADKNAGQDKAVTANGLILSGADAGNYDIGPVAAALADISRRAVTVRANDITASIFDRDPALGYALTNGSLAQGDGFTGALAREPGHTPGTYAIGRGTLALSPNYELTYVPGTMTIEIGSFPARMLPASLYQAVELGGRAAALHSRTDPLVWVPMLACATTEGETECVESTDK